MFSFFEMAGNYESRKVDRYEQGDLIVDTCSVTDGNKPYETAVSHPDYKDGNWIPVEAYDTKEEAQEGHDRWVKMMTAKDLPLEIKDCANALIAELLEFVAPTDALVFKRKVRQSGNKG